MSLRKIHFWVLLKHFQLKISSEILENVDFWKKNLEASFLNFKYNLTLKLILHHMKKFQLFYTNIWKAKASPQKISNQNMF